MSVSLPKQNKGSFITLPLAVFLFTTGILSLIQVKVENPLLLAERFFPGAGWIEIFFIGLYGALLTYKMSDPKNVARWRILSWSIFSLVFFSQLILGVLFSDKFLMSGNLHIPVPAMILAGPVYRGQLSIMTILFLSTVILTGPAWCSQLCYFGAIDGLFARKTINKGKTKYKMRIKHTALLLIIVVTILLRITGLNPLYALILGVSLGVGGLLFTILLSGRKGKMMHCILFCPIGTLVNYLKFINPFRLKIDISCTFCGSCSSICRYDAMSLADLGRKKPGITCTLCGDCLDVCQTNSIEYKLFHLNPDISRKIFLFITLSVHVIFLALARI